MILVTGGAGVLGSRLVKGLVKAGHEVRALTLPGDPFVSRLEGVECEIVYADVADRGSLKDVFDGVDAVFHLAAIIIAYDDEAFDRINVGGVRNMALGALGAGVEHFVYVSSAAVILPEASAYARSKWEGEKIVTSQNTMSYTIVRPTLIYEEGGGQEFMMFLDSLLQYPVVPFVGRGHALKNPVHSDDIVKGLLAIAGNPKTYGKIYNFSGGEAISIWDLAKLMLELKGESKPFIPVPIPLCRGIAWILERRMNKPPLTGYAISRIEQDANLDNTSAREDLGYDPIGVTEGLPRCFPRPD